MLTDIIAVIRISFGRVAVGRGVNGNPANAPIDLASPYTTNNYSFVKNTDNTVNAIGWGVSLNYQFGMGYEFNANLSSDQLNNVPANVCNLLQYT